MDAIIMSAGLGTRLRPLTDTIPKPLVPIAGKGSLERTLEQLPSEVTRVILVVGYLADVIRERIGTEAHGRPVTYVTQDPLDGTGGCVRQVKRQVPDLSERFLVISGDDLYAASDLSALAEVPCGALVRAWKTVREGETKDAWKLTPNGLLEGIFRPSVGELAFLNLGAYCLDHQWFDTAPVLVPGKTGEWSLPHAIPELLSRGVLFVGVPATFWVPITTMEDIATAEDALRKT